MRVSVVIPVYNEEKNITATLNSIVRTGYTDMEILVVDDGSTDRTPAIVKKYADKRVRLLGIKRKGRSGALNYGISKATGDYVLITDADSQVNQDWIEQGVKSLEQEGVGAVTGPHFLRETKSMGQKMHLLLVLLLHDFLPELLAKFNFCPKITGANVGFEKSIFGKVGFSEETTTDTLDISFKIVKTGKRLVFNPRMLITVEEPERFGSYFTKYKRWFGEIGRHLLIHMDVFRKASAADALKYVPVWLFFLGMPALGLALTVLAVYEFVAFGTLFWLNVIALLVALLFTTVLAFSTASIAHYRKWRALAYLPLWLILLPTIAFFSAYSIFRYFTGRSYTGQYKPHRD
ncbi:MAG: glycosyltransferase family 2 protein [archaeon]